MDEKMSTGLEIAVIGMAARFPGAKNIHEFWNSLKNGIETISFFSEGGLKETGISTDLLSSPYYISTGGILEDIEYFDASFFGYIPKEAEIMDPQMCIFHECVWTALEDAGYDPGAYKGLIGLYAGAASNLGWQALVLLSRKSNEIGHFAAEQLTQRDYLTLRISYKLNLTGPSFELNTACSTSLVAIHIACQAVLNGECHMALAGGITVSNLDKRGYMYQEGMVHSSDGHCRAFDARANGTVSSDGAGVVLLKRLEDAITDRDHIYAVIKGSAINNDGLRKAGFTAASVEGQAEVIKMALQMAEVEPESISYIETHGTGTKLGDTVEIEGLKLAFNTNKRQFCAIGSVKTNLGHTDCAAGAAGFIKTILTLKYRLIPPSLHFEHPNPNIDFENSPFYLNTNLTIWKNEKYPLRAGVSSFGMGGTNAHVVLEQAPVIDRSSLVIGGDRNERQSQLILLSAKTETALDKMTENLVNYFKKNLTNPGHLANPGQNPINPGLLLADAAYTLQVGRKPFEYRRMLVCSTNDVKGAIEGLSNQGTRESRRYYRTLTGEGSKYIVFLFAGLGSQYENMGLELYQKEPEFRREMERCFDILNPLIGYNIKNILYPQDSLNEVSGGKWEDGQIEKNPHHSSSRIHHFEVAQLVIFILEYALARLLMHWGISPDAMIGYSFGEYTAACISGVFSLEDALKLIVTRSQLIKKLSPGGMFSVPLPADQLKPLLTNELSIAIDNGSSCVIAGPEEAVNSFEKLMKQKKYLCMRLQASQAIHSPMIGPILKEFQEKVEGFSLKEPQIPYISNVSGNWITIQEAVDPLYWARHLKETVRFAEGIKELAKVRDTVFLEIGPGRNLSSLVMRYIENNPGQNVVNLVRHPQKDISDISFLLNKIGLLWLWGVEIDWNRFYPGEGRQRIPLPTYPFERQRYWIDISLFKTGPEMMNESLVKGITDMVPGGGNSQAHINKSVELESVKGMEPSRADKKTPSVFYSRPNLLSAYKAPRTPFEKAIADIWQTLFGFGEIGAQDDFLELGGDSLKAITVISRMHKELKVEIPLTEFFNRLTIEKLSEFIEIKSEDKNSYTTITSAEEKDHYVLSSAQRRLYILQQIDSNGIGYNETQTLVFEGNVSREKLEKTLQEMIERHEILRTSIEMVEGEPVQRIHQPQFIKFAIEYFDLVGDEELSTTSKTEVKVEEIIRNFVKPFDFSKAPLMRAALINSEENSYIFVVDKHHIITDGTSHEVFAKEFKALYKGRELPPLNLHYKDYSEWQQSQVGKKRFKKQEEYWLKQFERDIPVLSLPTDYTRPAVQSFEGSALVFALDEEETKKLIDMARAEGGTVFMVLLAVFNIFLAKLSGQEDIVVGTPTTGRKHADLEQVIGMFVNTLVLRNFVLGHKIFREFFLEVKDIALNAFENQEYPFEDLIENAAVERDVSRNPLFDVMFILQQIFDPSRDTAETEMEGMKMKLYAYEQKISKFDLSLIAEERGGRLYFSYEYCTKLYRKETIEKFVGYFREILSSVIRTPEKRILELEIISEKERRQILSDFNDTEGRYPEDKTLHELVESQAERIPDDTAVVFQDQYLTLKKLNECSNRLARVLREEWLLPDLIVGLMADISLEMVIGMLGILKAGGAFLPIEPDYPVERITFMIEDSHASVVLTKQCFQDKIKIPLTIPIIDLEDQRILNREWSNLEKINNNTDLVYAIYTSGSTGNPKGVLIQHNNIVNQIYGLHKWYSFESRFHHILLAPFTFDPSVQQIFLPLISGGKLYLVSKSTKEDAEKLLNYIVSNQLDIVNTVPSLMDLLLDYVNNYNGLHFKYIILAGEPFSAELHSKLRDSISVDKLINIYGPTEATINTTLYECKPEDTTIPIGKPLMNYKVLILDKGFYLVPLGVPGEISISGKGISRGYLNQPELTRGKFIASPFFPAERIYRTGDLARWLPDGNIQFLGRIDQQVKIRGNRIELGEIENQLLKHNKIRKVVVIAKEYKKENKDLCAYYVTVSKNPRSEEKIDHSMQQDIPGDNNALNISDLREFLKKRLPDYMIPSYFMQLEEIPLTNSGKVDVKALPEIGRFQMKLEKAYVPPDTDMEKTIADIWKDVLKLDEMGIHDNFFDVGGNSLDIIKVNSQLKKMTNKNISIVSMFRYSTIYSLAQYLGQQSEKNDFSLEQDRVEALKQGERDRNLRLQMRKKLRKD